jgi:hypothetical protein
LSTASPRSSLLKFLSEPQTFGRAIAGADMRAATDAALRRGAGAAFGAGAASTAFSSFFLFHHVLLVVGRLRHEDDFDLVGRERSAVLVDDRDLLQIQSLRVHEALLTDLIGEVLQILLDLIEGNDSHR